jgi:hypothetical protein
LNTQPSVTTEVLRVHQAINAAEAVADDQQALRAAAAELYEHVHAARDAGHGDEVAELLEESHDRAAGPLRRVFAATYLQENDREFRGLGIDGIDVRRVELFEFAGRVPDLEIDLVPTPAGSLIPRSTRAGEHE